LAARKGFFVSIPETVQWWIERQFLQISWLWKWMAEFAAANRQASKWALFINCDNVVKHRNRQSERLGAIAVNFGILGTGQIWNQTGTLSIPSIHR
jgi:hypothetical protein